MLTLALALVSLAQSPTTDVRGVVTRTAWHTREVAVGVTWRRAHSDALFGGPQHLGVLLVELGEPSVALRFAAGASLQRTSALAEPTAAAAVNGGFFLKDGAPDDLLKIDGTLRQAGLGKRPATVGIRGRRVFLRETPVGDLARAEHALAAGPWLVRGGRVRPEPGGAIHPRTALGITADRRLVLLTVDGRTDRARGMSMRELAEVMAALDCHDAMNLDGGGSTTMWVRSSGGVVNCPCDNKMFDAAGERAVSNAVLVLGRAIWTEDEDRASFASPTAWESVADPRCVDGDCAVATEPATATFTFARVAPGSYLVEVGLALAAGATAEGTLAGRTVEVRGGKPWTTVGRVEATDAPIELRLAIPAGGRLDAARLVETPR